MSASSHRVPGWKIGSVAGVNCMTASQAGSIGMGGKARETVPGRREGSARQQSPEGGRNSWTSLCLLFSAETTNAFRCRHGQRLTRLTQPNGSPAAARSLPLIAAGLQFGSAANCERPVQKRWSCSSMAPPPELLRGQLAGGQPLRRQRVGGNRGVAIESVPPAQAKPSGEGGGR